MLKAGDSNVEKALKMANNHRVYLYIGSNFNKPICGILDLSEKHLSIVHRDIAVISIRILDVISVSISNSCIVINAKVAGA